MKKFFVFSLALIFLLSAGFVYAAGDRHHPTGKRYGYVQLPLTSFFLENSATGALTASVATGTYDGIPKLFMYRGSSKLVVQVHVPDDYYTNGALVLKLLKEGGLAPSYTEWSLAVTNVSGAEDTTDTSETAVQTASPTSGSVETATFLSTEAESNIQEDSTLTYKLWPGRADYGFSSIVDAYFRYEKKTDT